MKEISKLYFNLYHYEPLERQSFAEIMAFSRQFIKATAKRATARLNAIINSTDVRFNLV